MGALRAEAVVLVGVAGRLATDVDVGGDVGVRDLNRATRVHCSVWQCCLASVFTCVLNLKLTARSKQEGKWMAWVTPPSSSMSSDVSSAPLSITRNSFLTSPSTATSGRPRTASDPQKCSENMRKNESLDHEPRINNQEERRLCEPASCQFPFLLPKSIGAHRRDTW